MDNNKEKLDYKKYANWVLVEYYKNSYEDIEKNRQT